MTLQATRDMLKDERIWAIAARVAVHDGESEHFDVTEEGHIMLSVITLRHGVEINALLKGGDDAGTGVWFIPSVGTEVIVNFDDGEFEGDAYVVAIVGEKPDGISLAPNKLFLIGPDVEIRSVNGTAKKLAYYDELKALENYVKNQFDPVTGHQHKAVVPALPTALAPSTTTSTGANLAPTASGTTVVKGE